MSSAASSKAVTRVPAGCLLFARLGAAIALAALLAFPTAPAAGREILHHVHGLAFAPDGRALMVPAHTGLTVYRDGRWSLAPRPAHDYMGFSVTSGAIYTSGHPAPGAPLRNPLRVSLDGRLDASPALPKLEPDFVTYIAQNPVKPAELAIATRRKNVYLSPDAGKSWKQIAREGEGR